MSSPPKLSPSNFEVERLPGTPYLTPVAFSEDDGVDSYTGDKKRVMYNVEINPGQNDPTSGLSFKAAGLHKYLHFNPVETTVAIVSCGGLCPGLNDVIRSVVYQCLDQYNCKKVLGFRYGYYGLTREGDKYTICLDHQVVSNVHRAGGSFLGTSRGPQPAGEMVDTLIKRGVNILICIGGDGTQRGAYDIHTEIKRRGMDIGVVGIPKTIDNDISFNERTFGFDTAVSEAVRAIQAGYYEAKSHRYGIGLVRLMGRLSGFIAAQATISAGQCVHICLIPENDVPLEVVLKLLERRFEKRTYCVIVVAEGFGQGMLSSASTTVDKSGNKVLGDIGIFLKDKIGQWLKANSHRYPDSTIKYIDPSYIIRSCLASTNDAAFCTQLANHAVHEAFHGSTGCIIGQWANQFVCVPTPLATGYRKYVELSGALWRSVREITISARRGNIGGQADPNDPSLSTAALGSTNSDAENTINALNRRIQELEHLIGTVKDREQQKDKQLRELYSKQTEVSPAKLPSISHPRSANHRDKQDQDDRVVLEALEMKYAKQKERLLASFGR